MVDDQNLHTFLRSVPESKENWINYLRAFGIFLKALKIGTSFTRNPLNHEQYVHLAKKSKISIVVTLI